MFKKTRLRLVILNTIVFFILLNAFGSTLYFYTQYRLYKQADINLLGFANHLRLEDVAHLTRGFGHDEDRNIAYLLWDSNGQLVNQFTTNGTFTDSFAKLQPRSMQQSLETIDLNGYPYRVLNVPIHLMNFQGTSEQILQFVYSLRPEQEVLKSLLFVIGIGVIVSAILAIPLGLFLANRSLIPIQKAWKKQEEFTADASHELRTPLTVIQLHLERLFRHPNHTIKDESDHISVVIQETKRMNKLVEELLTLARSDSNEVRILQLPVKLDVILERVVKQFGQLAEMKDIQLNTLIDQDIKIIGDEERLQQLFIILFDNALKYTEAKGSITISCQKASNFIQVVIEDTGVGIGEQDLPFVFDRFYRASKSRTRSDGGTGLGLSIAKWIVDSHEGTIKLESKLGKGTSVAIAFPLKKKK